MERTHHCPQLFARGAIRRHQNNDVADGAGEYAAAGHCLADADTHALARGERLAGAPVADQFNSSNQADLSNVTYVWEGPQ